MNKEIFFIEPFIMLVFFGSIYELVGSLYFKWKVNYWFITYNLLSYATIFYFYFKILNSKYKYLFLFFGLGILFLFLSIAIKYTIDDFFLFNYQFKLIQTIFILVFSFLWFRQVFKQLKVVSLIENSIFFIISGLILYYCGTFFLFLVANHVYLINKSLLSDYWFINLIFNIVLDTFLIISIWKARMR
ncbi:hypothetical protein [Flavobacterium sp.]|uniref:hypothetical protein n=1 Tax=Flavobacterium sp. TaxID=239 RepID=UPI002FDD0A90